MIEKENIEQTRCNIINQEYRNHPECFLVHFKSNGEDYYSLSQEEYKVGKDLLRYIGDSVRYTLFSILPNNIEYYEGLYPLIRLDEDTYKSLSSIVDVYTLLENDKGTHCTLITNNLEIESVTRDSCSCESIDIASYIKKALDKYAELKICDMTIECLHVIEDGDVVHMRMRVSHYDSPDWEYISLDIPVCLFSVVDSPW